jgi:YbbR domain-containing protein
VRATLRWIASNAPLMVLALALAALAWVAAIEEEDPTLEQRYPQLVPIVPSELPDGMVIVGDFDEQVQVTVRAPRSVWQSLEADDFTVTVDLTELGAGAHEVLVQVLLDRHPSRVIRVEPESVSVELAAEAERAVPVRVQIEGEPALGYLMRTPVVVPSQVTVSGPSPYVTRVVEVGTRISVQDADADIEREIRLQLQDGEGQSVPYVTLTPEVVKVRIPIELSGYYRMLAVKVVPEGQVGPGYRITDISVDPPNVTVFGIPDVIAALPGYIETEPIDLEGAQADVVERPALNVPPDVAVVTGEQPMVRVSIEAIQSSMTVKLVPELQGLGPGLTATVSPESAEFILSGPLPMLETLQDDDARLVLDLFGLSPGTHQVEPQLIVPEGVTAQSILSTTVQVEVFTAPATVPTESPSEEPGGAGAGE